MEEIASTKSRSRIPRIIPESESSYCVLLWDELDHYCAWWNELDFNHGLDPRVLIPAVKWVYPTDSIIVIMASNQGVDAKSIEPTKNIKSMWEDAILKKKQEIEQNKMPLIHKALSDPAKPIQPIQHHTPITVPTPNPTFINTQPSQPAHIQPTGQASSSEFSVYTNKSTGSE